MCSEVHWYTFGCTLAPFGPTLQSTTSPEEVCKHTHTEGGAESAANKVVPSSERVSRVLLMLGEEQHEVAAMGEGNIAVAVGMKNVSSSRTGYHCSQTLPGYII